MDFLANFMWFISIVLIVVILLCFIGSISLENDKAKANRYLADLHDREELKRK